MLTNLPPIFRKRSLVILIVLLGFFRVGVMAQTTDSIRSKYPTIFREQELGINFYSYLVHNRTYFINTNPSCQSFVNGLMYKRHLNSNALRVGLDIFHYNNDWQLSSEPDTYRQMNHEKSLGGEFRVGYEKTLLTGKLQPFLAEDVFVRFESTTEILQNYSGSYLYSSSTQFRMLQTSVGIAPVVGLRYKPTSHFSATVEANMNFFYAWYHNSTSVDATTFGSRGRSYSPVRLVSLNYHF